ncbi:hypothetical protein M413DRAFT_79943, partial [Hebeloma cylindrosporum]
TGYGYGLELLGSKNRTRPDFQTLNYSMHPHNPPPTDDYEPLDDELLDDENN